MTRYFEVLTGSELMPGVIAAIQTFGDRIDLPSCLHQASIMIKMKGS